MHFTNKKKSYKSIPINAIQNQYCTAGLALWPSETPSIFEPVKLSQYCQSDQQQILHWTTFTQYHNSIPQKQNIFVEIVKTPHLHTRRTLNVIETSMISSENSETQIWRSKQNLFTSSSDEKWEPHETHEGSVEVLLVSLISSFSWWEEQIHERTQPVQMDP